MIKMKFIIFSFLMAGFFSSSAQIGKTFPNIAGESLSESEISMPESTMGKYTLVGLAYSKRSENGIKSWYQPIYDKFVLKLGMFDKDYDINLMFIPMYTGTKKLAYGATIKELKESNAEDLFPYVMFYKGDIKQYIKELKMDEKDHPYFFVLDEEGKIVHKVKGMYSDKKMEKIEEVIGG